ncbi:ATP-binding protein [Ideonella sp. YS5]|uniref:ATP-binding protein n=1 Tax=Ideonella sp. YS5 TaxID=3453714 RepID=UPI003EE8F6E5
MRIQSPTALVPTFARFLAASLLLLIALTLAGPAWAATDLAAWRQQARAARLLAENDVPRAMAEARRLQAMLPPDAPPADRALMLNLLSRIETYLALTSPAEEHARQAHQLATAHGDRIGIAEADLNIALNSINQGKLEELVKATSEVVTALEGVDRPDLLGEAMLRACVMYRRFEQFEESVEIAVQAMEIARRSGDPLALAYAHQSLALSYDQSIRQQESLQHFEQMRVQARVAKSRMLEGFALQGVTGQALRDKDFEAAERLGRQALELFREIGAPFAVAFAHYGLATTLRAAGRFSDAVVQLDQAREIYEHYPNRIGLWMTLIAESAVQQDMKNHGVALAHAERANEIANDLGFSIYTSASAARLAETFSARGDYERAYTWSTRARELSGKAARERANSRVLQLTQRYETENKQRHVDELTRSNEQQTAELRQRELQQRWLWTLLAGAGIVLAMTGYFLLRLKRSHKLLSSLNAELARSRDAVRELNAGLEQRIEARTAQLRQQARYLRTLIDMLPLWAWFKDTDNRYLVTNQAYANAHGFKPEEMVGRGDEGVVPPALLEAAREDDRAVLASRERRTSEVELHEGGQSVWMETFKAPVLDDDGTLLGTVGVARDISAQKATEAAREAALEEARRLAGARSAFLAKMSHELRTPLNAILGFAQILLDSRHLDERQLRSARIIRQSGEHLLALINDVIDLARVDAGKLTLSPGEVDLSNFLAVVADIIRVKADEKQVQFSVQAEPDLPAMVRVDDMRLRQVLLNLLANAVKFTDAGQVSLRVRALGPPTAGADGQWQTRLHFEVADSGIGMSEDQLQRLFLPFEQVGDARRRSGGAGLGLAISRELVRVMGSELQVLSQPGHGSVFSFDLELPVVAGGTLSSALGRIIGHEGPRRRVLVVDDSPALRALLADTLSLVGFDVITANDGQEGVTRARLLKPHLIVMDMTMPVMGGLDATRALRAEPGFAELPVVMTTASDSVEVETACFAAGANAFLSKPIDSAQLLRTIGRLLSLTWIHEQPAAAAGQAMGLVPTNGGNGTSGTPPSPMVGPPPDELDELLRLARIGNMREIRARAEQLRELGPRYQPFATRLCHLADNYQSQAILSLVESCGI